MRTRDIILNVQDGKSVEATIDYLAKWESTARIWLSRCPICPKERRVSDKGIVPWYVIIRRNTRALTVRCRTCLFQFTFTYHNLRKGCEGLAALAGKESGKVIEMDKELELLDCLETRGKQSPDQKDVERAVGIESKTTIGTKVPMVGK